MHICYEAQAAEAMAVWAMLFSWRAPHQRGQAKSQKHIQGLSPHHTPLIIANQMAKSNISEERKSTLPIEKGRGA